FALVPLAELAPEAIIPGHGTVRHALQGVDGCGLEPIG
ncbi:2-amino-4-hydroxy-6-hydroxymethyldihydropteridine diphosphokinase, partial [Xanthomonas campestris pv. campestris]|nr:2-amino-4-hydroxy-6-hydroxymethyldihydropteridine diphosphokinase [Xanthomonas campestris pv. campestris]